jgi:hypothetical protein
MCPVSANRLISYSWTGQLMSEGLRDRNACMLYVSVRAARLGLIRSKPEKARIV